MLISFKFFRDRILLMNRFSSTVLARGSTLMSSENGSCFARLRPYRHCSDDPSGRPAEEEFQFFSRQDRNWFMNTQNEKCTSRIADGSYSSGRKVSSAQSAHCMCFLLVGTSGRIPGSNDTPTSIKPPGSKLKKTGSLYNLFQSFK